MYRTLIFMAVFLMALLFLANARDFKDPFRFPQQNTVMGGLGITWIDEQPYTTFTIAPDIAIGKFGMGIYLQLLFDNQNNWKFRSTEYKDGPGILRMIRYIRYGQKYDPQFFLVGTIDRATLAHGFLVWNYNNASTYDKRRIGLIADLDLNQGGVETVWGSMSFNTFWGANVYVRPLRFMQNAPPILDRLRIYGTYARDGEIPSGQQLDSTDALSAYGFGMDLQWLKIANLISSTVYADYSQIVDYGNGKALGIDVVFPNFVGIFGLSAKLEKRFIGRRFLPGLFGPLYELNRQLGLQNVLENSPKTEGYLGELGGHILNRILLLGSFQKLNGIPGSGILHLEASAPTLIPRIELRGYYDKSGIETFRDVRTLDTRSVLSAEASYQMYAFFYFTAIYRWYWLENPEQPGEFNPVERFEPRITMRYNF